MSAEVTTVSSIEELQPRMAVRGVVKRLELYGAFVDIGVGTDALLHISQLSENNVRNVEDVLTAGDEITVYILRVDLKEKRIALSMMMPPEVTWDDLTPGATVTGKVVRVENFGVFVDIGAERPGMVHVSELTNGFVKSPSDVVNIGDEVEARILKVNRKKRQIDLTMKEAEPEIDLVVEDEEEDVPTAMELALRRAMAQADDDSAKSSQARGKKKNYRQNDDIMSRALRNNHRG